MPSSSTAPLFVQFEPDELIFATGDPGDTAYIIETGQIEIFIDQDEQPLRIRYLGPGDVLGEMAVIDAAPRSASARALVTTRCIVISSQQISERIDESDPVVRLLITTLLSRMRTLTPQPDPKPAVPPDLKELQQDEQKTVPCQPLISPLTPCPSAPTPVITPAQVTSAKVTPTPVPDEAVIDKIRLESELRTAIDLDQLIPHYQALVNLHTGQIIGFELLVRWQSPSRGRVSPGLFIKIAEETSLIIPVGCWALKAAVQAAQDFQQQSGQSICISVNISAKQFLAPDFIQQLTRLIPTEQINNIKLEITESLVMAGERVSQTLRTCRDMGFHLSLDDFGTGFSSLSYLSDLEVDSVKVDRAFVRKMMDHKRTYILTKTILTMTHDLGMVSIAEGIETTNQRDILKDLGCHIGQGYLFSPPVDFEAALKLLERQSMLP